MADMLEAVDTCPVPVIARVHGAALGGGMGLCAVADIVIAESGRPVRVHRDTARDPAGGHLARSSSPRSARATPGPCSPAGAGSMPSAPSGSGSSTRSSRGRRPWTRRSMRRSRTCSSPARRRRGRRRRSSARSAAWATGRRSGTRRASSPASGSPRRPGRLRRVRREAPAGLGPDPTRTVRPRARPAGRSRRARGVASSPDVDGPTHRDCPTSSPGALGGRRSTVIGRRHGHVGCQRPTRAMTVRRLRGPAPGRAWSVMRRSRVWIQPSDAASRPRARMARTARAASRADAWSRTADGPAGRG